MLALAVCLCPISTPGRAQDSPAGATVVTVHLLTPLTTKFSRKGDLVSARVFEPEQYRDGILEGEVGEVKPGGPGGKTSSIQFDFRSLHLSGKTLAMSLSLVSGANSHHQSTVDEDGSAVEFASRGVAGKLVSSVFSSGSATPLKLTAKGPRVSFAPGSEFTLELQAARTH